MDCRILIVEDEPEERKIFSTYLRFVGAQLLEAKNGREGLRLAREHHPDLVLTDLGMPVMDGWEMMRHFQRDPVLSRIPTVAVTANRLPAERLAEAGFQGYLEKPIAPFKVLQEVERWVGQGGQGGAAKPPARPRMFAPSADRRGSARALSGLLTPSPRARGS